MGHYDEDVHCRKCGEYLGTHYMLSGDLDEKYYYCKDKKRCKKRKEGKIKVNYW